MHACKYLKEKSYQCKSKQGHLCEEYPQSIIVNPKLINTTYLEKWGTLYTLFEYMTRSQLVIFAKIIKNQKLAILHISEMYKKKLPIFFNFYCMRDFPYTNAINELFCKKWLTLTAGIFCVNCIKTNLKYTVICTFSMYV